MGRLTFGIPGRPKGMHMRFDNLMSLSRTHAKVVALLVAGALVTPMLSGCGTDTSTATDSTDSTAATATSGATEETAETESATSEDTTESETATAADSTEKSSESTAEEDSTETEASNNETSGTSTSTDAETETAAATDDTTSSDTTSSDSTDTDSTDSDSDTTEEEEETIDFSYSQDIDDDGHWTGVTALDYVTLPEDYASISVPSSTAIPTDDDVQTQIDTMLSNYSTSEQVTDREVADGDTINIDYVGKIDGVEFDGGSTEGNGTTVTIGTTQYIDDFLEQLIGHKPGETFDIEVTFPDDYGNDELNGKDATFTVTINYISETTTPELTDDWVNENLSESYGWTTVDELKQGIKENLQYTNVANYVQDYVLNNSTVTEVPETILNYQGQQYLYMYQQYAENYGYTFSSMLEMMTGSPPRALRQAPPARTPLRARRAATLAPRLLPAASNCSLQLHQNAPWDDGKPHPRGRFLCVQFRTALEFHQQG